MNQCTLFQFTNKFYYLFEVRFKDGATLACFSITTDSKSGKFQAVSLEFNKSLQGLLGGIQLFSFYNTFFSSLFLTGFLGQHS